jgi:radical SAM superfamily enzyme
MIESESKSITRKNNIEKMIDALRNVFDRQIPYEISLIYGLPGQTLNSFRRSIDILHDIGIYDIVAFPLMLLPGTQLYLENEKWGMNEEVLGDFNIPLVTSSNSFTRMEWEEMDRIASNLNSKVRFR